MNPIPRAGEAVPTISFAEQLARYQASEHAYNHDRSEDKSSTRKAFDIEMSAVKNCDVPAISLQDAVAAVRQALAEEEEDNGAETLTGVFLTAAMKYFDTLPDDADPEDGSVASAMRDLEDDVLSLFHMAEIAFEMSADILFRDAVARGESRVSLNIGIDQRERFSFAVANVANRAGEFKARYFAAWHEGVQS